MGNDELMTCDFQKLMLTVECLPLFGSGLVWFVEMEPHNAVQTGSEITKLLNQPPGLDLQGCAPP